MRINKIAFIFVMIHMFAFQCLVVAVPTKKAANPEPSLLEECGVRVLNANEIPPDITNVLARIGSSKQIERSELPFSNMEKSLQSFGKKVAPESGCQTLEDALLLFLCYFSVVNNPDIAFEFGDWLVLQYVAKNEAKNQTVYGWGIAVKKGTRTLYKWSNVDAVLGRQRKSQPEVENERVVAELRKGMTFCPELAEAAKKLVANGQARPPAITDDIAVMALALLDGPVDDPDGAMAAYRVFSERMRELRLEDETRTTWTRYEGLLKELHELAGGDELLAIFVRANVLGELDEYVRGKGARDKQAAAIRAFVREEARKLVEEYPESALKVMLRRMAEGKSPEFELEEERTGGARAPGKSD